MAKKKREVVDKRSSVVPGKGVMSDKQRKAFKKSGFGKTVIKIHDSMLGKRKAPKKGKK